MLIDTFAPGITLQDLQRDSRRINPTLHIHPYSAASFLELSYPTTNGDPFIIWAMLDDERRRGWGRGFGIDPALDVTTVALKEVDANHAVHCRPGERDADQATAAPR